MRFCPFVQLPPLRVAVAMLLPLLIATEETVGAVVQFPPRTNLELVNAVIALLKVAIIEDGTGSTKPVAGIKVDSVGGVLSILIAELSDDGLDRFPKASFAVPAFTWTVRLPFPVQLLSVIVAPDADIELTVTVHDGFPLTVVSVTPPPPAVSVPVSAVPPDAEAV